MKGILQYILNQSYHGDCYIVLQSEKVESKMNFRPSWVLNKKVQSTGISPYTVSEANISGNILFSHDVFKNKQTNKKQDKTKTRLKGQH